MKFNVFFVAFSFLLILSSCDEKKLETAEMFIKDEKFLVEMARTEDEQRLGLMFRKELGQREGMLFIYKKWVKHGFWMKNVSIPLSIAFIGKDGEIIEIRDMNPFSERSIQPGLSYRYALEVNKGVFDKLAVKAGDYVKLPANLR